MSKLNSTFLIVTLVGVAVATGEPPHNEATGSTASMPEGMRLRSIPRTKLFPTTAPAPAPMTIQNLIRRFSELKSPSLGLSATCSGSEFSPIEGLRNCGALLLTNHGLVPFEPLRELVMLGPPTLPYLLGSLADRTPTALVTEHNSLFGGMWYAREMSFNPLNATERRCVEAMPKLDEFDPAQTVSKHTVTVGDVCFVAIGQIVGRGYQAVRYQPSGCIVINSPTHDSVLAKCVRSVWQSKDARRSLFESLVADFATEGVKDGQLTDAFNEASDLQIGATARLLYYFPHESASLVAARMRGLDVGSVGPGAGSHHTERQMEAGRRREARNAVRPDEFVKAVAPCRIQAVRDEAIAVFRRTGDPDVLLAALPAVDPMDEPLIRERIQSMLEQVPQDEGGPFGDGFNLLVALGKRGGVDAKAIFRAYLERGGLMRRRTMCHVLRETRGEWVQGFMVPLLTDTSDTGWTYAVNPGQNEPRLPIRVCDEAAETITKQFPEAAFMLAGDHAKLDRQIALIRRRFDKRI